MLAVTPADQTVTDAAAFVSAMRNAVTLAASGAIVTLGIVPTRPETGYGYIRAEATGSASRVLGFVEKPDLPTAERYLREGSYLWNGGIFVLKASLWMAALERFRPDIAGGHARGLAAAARVTPGSCGRIVPRSRRCRPSRSTTR